MPGNMTLFNTDIIDFSLFVLLIFSCVHCCPFYFFFLLIWISVGIVFAFTIEEQTWTHLCHAPRNLHLCTQKPPLVQLRRWLHCWRCGCSESPWQPLIPGLQNLSSLCVAAQETLPVTVQCFPLPWQGTKAKRLNNVAVAHWASGTEPETPKPICSALPLPHLSKGNVKLHVSSFLKIKEKIMVVWVLFFFLFH